MPRKAPATYDELVTRQKDRLAKVRGKIADLREPAEIEKMIQKLQERETDLEQELNLLETEERERLTASEQLEILGQELNELRLDNRAKREVAI